MNKLKGVGIRVELEKGAIQPTPSGGQRVAQPLASYGKDWTMVTNPEGTPIGFEDAKGKEIPESVWRSVSSDRLDNLATKTRISRTPGESESLVIPGLPVRGGKTVKPAGGG